MTDPITDKAARLLKLFTSPNRIRLLLAIVQESEVTGTQLRQQMGISQEILSIHLNKMKDYGLITRRREGRQVFYAIEDPAILEAIQIMLHRG